MLQLIIAKDTALEIEVIVNHEDLLGNNLAEHWAGVAAAAAPKAGPEVLSPGGPLLLPYRDR